MDSRHSVCPEWCAQKHDCDESAHRHAGEPINLAAPETGTDKRTARLVSGDDGVGCDVLIEAWTRQPRDLRLGLDELDLLLDALDDGGEKVIQELAGLVLRGATSTS